MTIPVIVFERGVHVHVFVDKHEASTMIEAWDLEHNSYEAAYGADGERLFMAPAVDGIFVEFQSTGTYEVGELAQRLLAYGYPDGAMDPQSWAITRLEHLP